MTKDEMIIKQKYTLLRLAQNMKSVTKACNIMNVSRQYYYKIKKRFEKYGAEGLKEIIRRKPNMPNQASPELEKIVIGESLKNPSYGRARIALELRLKNIKISETGVRKIWERNNLLTRKNRFLKLEEKVRKTGIYLTDKQLECLIKNSDSLKEKHVISYHPGYLLCQDTFEVGCIKNVGRIYMQGIIDTYGSFAFAKLYVGKGASEAADLIEEQVIPFYYNLGIPVLNILTDNGKEYCGNLGTHDYETLLSLLNIKHRRTKIRSPKTNGFIERFNRTVLEEFFSLAFRTKFYNSLSQLQYDLNKWMVKYNFKRRHQGYRVKGRTPSEVLYDYADRIKLIENKGI